jgi:hypothetical protein
MTSSGPGIPTTEAVGPRAELLEWRNAQRVPPAPAVGADVGDAGLAQRLQCADRAGCVIRSSMISSPTERSRSWSSSMILRRVGSPIASKIVGGPPAVRPVAGVAVDAVPAGPAQRTPPPACGTGSIPAA